MLYPESAATESLRMTITNDQEMLERFRTTVFLTNRLTLSIMTRFQHFVEKYIPIDSWAQGTEPDFMILAQEIIRYLHGSVQLSADIAYYQLTTESEATNYIPTHSHPETTLMSGYNVEKLTYIDGVCVDHMSDDEIVGRIAAIEKDVKALTEIKTASKAITKQVEKMGKTTNLLAAFLDGRLGEDDKSE